MVEQSLLERRTGHLIALLYFTSCIGILARRASEYRVVPSVSEVADRRQEFGQDRLVLESTTCIALLEVGNGSCLQRKQVCFLEIEFKDAICRVLLWCLLKDSGHLLGGRLRVRHQMNFFLHQHRSKDITLLILKRRRIVLNA